MGTGHVTLDARSCSLRILCDTECLEEEWCLAGSVHNQCVEVKRGQPVVEGVRGVFAAQTFYATALRRKSKLL